MTFRTPGGASVAVFVLILASVVAALVSAVHVASTRLGVPAAPRTLRVAAGVVVWLLVLAAFVTVLDLEAKPVPGVAVFFLASNVAGVVLGLSRVGDWLTRGLPLAALVGFQAFRLPLELVLHDWARQGSIPETMTWTGSNLDIVSGVVALVAAVLLWRGRGGLRVAWLANVVGLTLLLNVMRVAVLSSPLPFAWHVQPPLLLAAHLPFAFIVPVCVSGALAGHIVLTRALLTPQRLTDPPSPPPVRA